MLRAVIIDDEVKSREAVTHMIDLFGEEKLVVVGYGSGVKSGIETINELNPDLVFLDIKMSDGTGFDLLKSFKKINFDVIFITAYDEFAIKAFKYSAIDYILKPIDPEKFTEAVERVDKHREKSDLDFQLKVLMNNMNQPASAKEEKKMVLKTSNNVYVVKVKDIIRCESDRNYTRFYVKGEPSIFVSKSLKVFVDLLEEFAFFRVHQSHLINLNCAKQYVKDECICIMDDDSKIPVSTRKREILIKKFEEL
ncbi:MAG: LytTR family DNA-binding domain-containing protein [Bacteroidota bacterium]|nr:LytTR family DNA-binding domain-containing protein [Bacteroidota bacterium]